MGQSFHLGLGGQQVALEDGGQRVAVAEVEVRQAGDRDVELHRVHAGAKQAGLVTALQHVGQRGHERGVHGTHLGRLLEVARPVQVLVVEQVHELRVGDVVVPCEGDEAPDRLDGLHQGQVQFPLLGTDAGVGPLQHRQEQAFLALEVVIDQAFVDASPLGDAVHAGAAQTLLGELHQGRVQDVLLGTVSVARARLCRSRRPCDDGRGGLSTRRQGFNHGRSIVRADRPPQGGAQLPGRACCASARLRLLPHPNRLRSTPMPSISTSTSVPGFIGSTPSEVPHRMTSPGSRVRSCEMRDTSSAGSKIMSASA